MTGAAALGEANEDMPDDEHQETAPAATGEQLARWLRALAAEVERDPALAERIASVDATPLLAADPPALPTTTTVQGPLRTREPELSLFEAEDIAPVVLKHRRRATRYGTPTVAGRAADLGKGVPDPFAVLAASDETSLRRALETLRAGTLRAIIRTHNLDPVGKLPPEATEKRMITMIIAATKRAAKANVSTTRTTH